MAEYSGPERRRDPRVPVRMVLESEIASRGEKARLETLNMSAGGFSCVMDRPVEYLTLLKLSMSFPAFGGTTEKPREIDCSAVVVRCEPLRSNGSKGYEVAASFTWIRPEDRKLLSDYLAWYRTVYVRSAFLKRLARRVG